MIAATMHEKVTKFRHGPLETVHCHDDRCLGLGPFRAEVETADIPRRPGGGISKNE
jgi:hypothetical protein